MSVFLGVSPKPKRSSDIKLQQEIRESVWNCRVIELTCKLPSAKPTNRYPRGVRALGASQQQGWPYLPCRGLRCSSRSSCWAIRVPWMASQPGLNTEYTQECLLCLGGRFCRGRGRGRLLPADLSCIFSCRLSASPWWFRVNSFVGGSANS